MFVVSVLQAVAVIWTMVTLQPVAVGFVICLLNNREVRGDNCWVFSAASHYNGNGSGYIHF